MSSIRSARSRHRPHDGRGQFHVLRCSRSTRIVSYSVFNFCFQNFYTCVICLSQIGHFERSRWIRSLLVRYNLTVSSVDFENVFNGATLRGTGRGLGSFIGGILMANYGTRNAFQIFGTGAGLAGVTYFLLHRLYLVQMERLRLRRKSGNGVFTLTFQCHHFHFRLCYLERIASIIASGEEFDDEPEEEYIIPPDNLLGRRKSCF